MHVIETAASADHPSALNRMSVKKIESSPKISFLGDRLLRLLSNDRLYVGSGTYALNEVQVDRIGRRVSNGQFHAAPVDD